MKFSQLPLTPDGELWVFAYGSLMWAPDFEPARARPVLVHGWRRGFTLRSTQAWGCKARPGLCASLHVGGAVAGRALLIRAGDIEKVLDALAQREAAYLPRTVTGRERGKLPFPMLTFVHDYNHPRSVAGLTLAEQAQLVAQGVGKRGSSLFYLRETLRQLALDGNRDRRAQELLALAVRL
jgi:cation transport protein ChaC